MTRTRSLVSLAAGAGLGIALWWRKHPSACPYNQRFWIQIPHPFITRTRLLELLFPQPGEKILEVGPGTGYYTLAVADRLDSSGRLEIFDLQQEMLDHVMSRAKERGLAQIRPRQGDARELPYNDAKFDAAYLVTVLGEIPDQQQAISELQRVLKPGGRLVVGELAIEPHAVTFKALSRLAEKVGLTFEQRIGGPLGYFARFTKR